MDVLPLEISTFLYLLLPTIKQYDPQQPNKTDYKLSTLDSIAHIGRNFLYLNTNTLSTLIHAISMQT